MRETPEIKQLIEALEKGINTLDPVLKRVIFQCYGLKPKNPSKAGMDRELNMAPEKKRALRKKAIRKLRNPRVCKPVIEWVKRYDRLIWETVSEEVTPRGRVVWRAQYSMALERLPAQLALAIDISHNELADWLDANTFQLNSSWVRSRYDEKAVLESVGKLEARLDAMTTPMLKTSLLEYFKIEKEFFDFILCFLRNDFQIHGIYITNNPILSAELRAIRLHRLLVRKYHGRSVPLATLEKEFNRTYRDDRVNETMVAEIVKRRPHLFELSGHLAGAAPAPGLAEDNQFETGKPAWYFPRPWEQTTAKQLIREILEQKGPCSIKEIQKEFLHRVQGRYTLINVYVAIGHEMDFFQPAPDIYSIERQDFSKLGEGRLDKLLLTKRQLLTYLLYRFAGESMNTYPLWTPALEYRWCLWSQYLENQQFFKSLLYISRPENWSTDLEETNFWLERKTWIADFQFKKQPWTNPHKKIPLLQDLFDIAHHLQRHGFTNWLRINSLLENNPKYTGASRYLAMLIYLKVVSPSEHWQMPHYPGPGLESFMEQLIEEIRKKGFLHWNDNAGIRLRREFRRGLDLDSIDWGWTRRDEAQKVLDTLEGKITKESISRTETRKPGRPVHKQLSLFDD